MRRTHTTLARCLHWGVAALYVYGVAKQLDDVEELADAQLLFTEVVFAAVFLSVVTLRYAYMRRFETFSPARAPIGPARRRAARALPGLGYLCFVLLPASGLWIAWLFARGVERGPWQDAAVGLHELCADLSYVLIGLHVAAAVLSRCKREGVWDAMVPVWRERPEGEER